MQKKTVKNIVLKIIANSSLAFTMLLIATGIGLMPTQSALAAGCSGTGCNGKDPAAMGCDVGATTVASAYIKLGTSNIGLVELRWSSTCKTNWARVTKYSSQFPAAMSQVMQSNGAGGEQTKVVSGNTQSWSTMWYNQTVKACGMLSNWGADGPSACTGYR